MMMMIIKQWFGLRQCRGALHILLSPAVLTAAFKATLEMTGGESAVPIRVPREKEERRWVRQMEREREGQGEKRGYK